MRDRLPNHVLPSALYAAAGAMSSRGQQASAAIQRQAARRLIRLGWIVRDLWAVRPDNWSDAEDAEQAAAWAAAGRAISVDGGPARRTVEAIPIAAARRIAEEYGYDQVVIMARKVGGQDEPHGEHLTTYGVDRVHCDVAARMGATLKRIMGWPEEAGAPSKPTPRPRQSETPALHAGAGPSPTDLAPHGTDLTSTGDRS